MNDMVWTPDGMVERVPQLWEKYLTNWLNGEYDSYQSDYKKYHFPRQCGTTTFLERFINSKIEQGKTVLFATFKDIFINNKKISIEAIRGKSVDFVILDNCTPNKTFNIMEFIRPAVVKGGKILEVTSD